MLTQISQNIQYVNRVVNVEYGPVTKKLNWATSPLVDMWFSLAFVWPWSVTRCTWDRSGPNLGQNQVLQCWAFAEVCVLLSNLQVFRCASQIGNRCPKHERSYGFRHLKPPPLRIVRTFGKSEKLLASSELQRNIHLYLIALGERLVLFCSHD